MLHGVYPRCRRLVRLGSIRPSYTLEVFAARCSTQTPWGVPSVTGDAVTTKSAPSRKHRDGRDTTNKRGRKGDSPSSGAAGEDYAARRTVLWLCFRSVDTLAGGLAGQPQAASGDTSLLVHAAYIATASIPS